MESGIVQILADRLGLTDDTYAEYITQLAEDTLMPKSEKKEIITEFLADAIENPESSHIEAVVDVILNQVEEALSLKRKEEERQKLESLKAAKELEIKTLHETTTTSLTSSSTSSSAQSLLTKEERRKRDKLLAQYGYDVDEMVENADGEMEILYSGKHKNDDSSNGSKEGLLKNDNAARVKEAELARRAKMQAEHEKVKQRDKAALEKQLADKEKEKRRTQKKEKRRM